MSSPRRRRLFLEQNRTILHDQVLCLPVFLTHFQWAQAKVKSLAKKPKNFEELLKVLLEGNELELFVVCLMHFGFYSMAYKYFNELDLERLSSFHKKLPLNIPQLDENFQIPQDMSDKYLLFTQTTLNHLYWDSLRRHQQLILCKLEIQPVLEYFKKNEVLSDGVVNKLRDLPSHNQQIIQLMHYIKEDRLICLHFYHSLLLSGQFELFAFLIDERMDWSHINLMGEWQRSHIINHLTQQYQDENTEPSLLMDQCKLVGNEEWPFDCSVDMPDTTMAKDLLYYRGDRKNIYKNFSIPKGLVLIINNENFICGLNQRQGTNRDEEALRKLFTNLGYTVLDTAKDLTGMQMLSTARKFSQLPQHAEAHSCVVIVLTHGEYDELIGVDGEKICVHEFVSLFNSTNAPNLAGKPKFFIVQACRGGNYDSGVNYPIPKDEADARPKTSTDFFGTIKGLFKSPTREKKHVRKASEHSIQVSSPSIQLSSVKSVEIKKKTFLENFDPEKHQLVKQPSDADIIVAYATVAHYVSWRNSAYGSWFVQSICQVFGEHAKDEDVASLLVKANRHVADYCESKGQIISKQTPEYISRLLKKFYLFPGITSE